jgi:hypothetical protein
MTFKTPWEFVNNCFLKIEPVTSDENQWESYHPCLRLMSFHQSLLKPIAQMSLLQTGIPDWAVGCTLYNLVPKTHKVPYTKYISAKSVTETESKELEAVKRIYCVGSKHGRQLVQILKQENVSLGEKGRKKKK